WCQLLASSVRAKFAATAWRTRHDARMTHRTSDARVRSRPETRSRVDVVIRGGTVVDGSGRPPYAADVVVAGDRIAASGRYDGAADEVIARDGPAGEPGPDPGTAVSRGVARLPRAHRAREPGGPPDGAPGRPAVDRAPPRDRDPLPAPPLPGGGR